MRAIVFDTETTDLLGNSALPVEQQPRVTEFFAKGLRLIGDAWEGEDELELLINPDIPIPAESTKITGITDEMVKDAPAMFSQIPLIENFFNGADIVVAHNLAFDMQIMDFEFERAKTKTPDYVETNSGAKFSWPAQKICTVESTMHLKGYRMRLMELYEYLHDGAQFKEAHRARNDVEALASCFVKLWEMGEI